MVKVASIDLGSNSTRMLIADITNGTITTIYKEHQVTRMADKLSESKIISKEATKRVLKVLAGYVKTINKHNVENIQIVGTAALRDATNSEEITQLIEKKFGFEVDIVSGEEEGVLTSVGVLNSLGSLENFLIVDIGGRSTELIYDDDKIYFHNYDEMTREPEHFNNLSTDRVEYKCTENTLLLFKSDLPHSTNLQTGEEKITISFNVS